MNVGEMQRKLSRKAERESNHRFDDLFNLIVNREWLKLAHDRISQNAGSMTAGCDGITMRYFDRHVEENLEKLAKELKEGTFQPFPVRRVTIPKTNGKVRLLGIPSIKDRIVQEALRMALEPIYEADFSQNSFGFRPNRCTMDAIKRIYGNMSNHHKYFWVIEGDIASCFDTINHKKLMKLLGQRIRDRKLLDLIWSFLRAGVMEGTLFHKTTKGTPQGGILSPLLANVYLHQLDKYMERYTALSQNERRYRRNHGQANFLYARYADDFVVTCNGTRRQAEELKGELNTFLRKGLKLTLSEEKTKVTHVNDGFEFLGIRIHRRTVSSGAKATTLRIPASALEAVCRKVKAATAHWTHRNSVYLQILTLNRIMRGWCHYYQYTSATSADFSKLERVAFWRLAHWLGRKFKVNMPKIMRRFRVDKGLGIKNLKLFQATSVKTRRWQKPCKKPNPYTMQEITLEREVVNEPQRVVYELRPGWADLRLQVLERDNYTCQISGRKVTLTTAHVDHRKPLRKFKRPIDANRLENLQTLHIDVHKEKTKSEWEMESRVR
jgi:RNA-directed DNA polymerase